jgi:hypothetical protein
MRWIGYISPVRYAFRALARNEFLPISQPFLNGDGTVGFTNGLEVLEFYDLSNSSSNMVQTVGGDVGILFSFVAAYLLLLYLACELFNRH